MENMASKPSQGGGLGRAFLGPAGIWSLEEGTGQDQAESYVGPFPLQSQYCVLIAETDPSTHGPWAGENREGA